MCDGVVDLVWMVNGYMLGLFLWLEVFELLGVYKNDMVVINLVLVDLFESDFKDDYKGVEVMFLYVYVG